VVRNRGKSFSARKPGSLDCALDAATSAREEAIATGGHGESVLRADPAGRMTVDDLLKEWCVKRNLGRVAERSQSEFLDALSRSERNAGLVAA